jgi:hypothetical protein
MIKILLNLMLGRLGVTLTQQDTTKAPLLNPNTQFGRDVAASEAFHNRRMGVSRRLDNNSESLM